MFFFCSEESRPLALVQKYVGMCVTSLRVRIGPIVRQLCPTGKSVARFSRTRKVQPFPQKFFAFAVGQNISTDSRVPCPDREGRFAIVTTRWARDAMDGESVRRELKSRWTRTLSAYDEVVWSWRRDAGVKFLGS
jgi:hypothetical protein